MEFWERKPELPRGILIGSGIPDGGEGKKAEAALGNIPAEWSLPVHLLGHDSLLHSLSG